MIALREKEGYCDNARKITKKVCLDLQAYKMLGNLAKILEGCSMGDNIIIRISSLDRGRSGYHKLRTKAGILTVLY